MRQQIILGRSTANRLYRITRNPLLYTRPFSSERMSEERLARFWYAIWQLNKPLALGILVGGGMLWQADIPKIAANIVDRSRQTQARFAVLHTTIGEKMNVPTERVSHTYVDRTITKRITKLFAAGMNIVVLRGFGGYGKTQLALNFAEANKDVYPVIIFVECPPNDQEVKEQTAWLKNILRSTGNVPIHVVKEHINQAFSNARQKLTGNPNAKIALRENALFASFLEELDKLMETCGYKALVIVDNVDLRLAWNNLYPWIGKSTSHINYLITSRTPPEGREDRARPTHTVKLRNQKLEVISVDGLTVSESQQYIKQYLVDANRNRAGVAPPIVLTDRQIAQLCVVSRCVPLALKILLKNLVDKVRLEAGKEQNSVVQHIFKIYESNSWADLPQQLDLLKTSVPDYAVQVLTNPSIDAATRRYASNTYNVSVQELKKSVCPFGVSSDTVDDFLLLYSLCGDVYISPDAVVAAIKNLNQANVFYASLTRLSLNDINVINVELVNNGLGRLGPSSTGVTIDYLMKVSIQFNVWQHILNQVPPIVTSRKSGGIFGWFATTTTTSSVDVAGQQQVYESLSVAAKQITTECCATDLKKHLIQELADDLHATCLMQITPEQLAALHTSKPTLPEKIYNTAVQNLNDHSLIILHNAHHEVVGALQNTKSGGIKFLPPNRGITAWSTNNAALPEYNQCLMLFAGYTLLPVN